ncbi:MAG: amino acid ABC transporter substrate-binding protein [Zetaproteobacteria bacterium]|nr:amino acid ABC transporter substrate-binding protein [Zetaproteobacteria bacterium]
MKQLSVKALVWIGVVEYLLCVASAATTRELVLKKGYVFCGVSQGLPGFSAPNSKGKWEGIDVDVCRAVASALFANADKVKYVPLSAKERFTALQSGEIDILSRNTTWTLTRDTALGLDFTTVTYYDGQGFMVRKKSGVKSAKELNGATLCVNSGTTTELNIEDYFKSLGMKYTLLSFEKTDEVVQAYDNKRCDVYTTDQSGLYANRIKLKNPSEHLILPEIISKEPLGPVVRHGDDNWADIVRWAHYSLLNAEEMGISSKNVDKMLKESKDPNVRRLLGVDGGAMGKHLQLSKDWAYNIVKQVGNYAEVFERNLGMNSPLKISRGLNKLWNQGGLQYGMPVR